MTKKIYKSMQGREIDMDALRAKNETTAAVGNVRMNARGDELGPGGTIVRKREDSVAEYYEDNPSAQPQQRQVPVASVSKSVEPPVVHKTKKVKDND